MGDYHKLEVWKLGSELSDRVAVLVSRSHSIVEADLRNARKVHRRRRPSHRACAPPSSADRSAAVSR